MNIVLKMTFVGLIAVCGFMPQKAEAGYFSKSVVILGVSTVALGAYMLYTYMTKQKHQKATNTEMPSLVENKVDNVATIVIQDRQRVVPIDTESEHFYVKENDKWVEKKNPHYKAPVQVQKTDEQKMEYATTKGQPTFMVHNTRK